MLCKCNFLFIKLEFKFSSKNLASIVKLGFHCNSIVKKPSQTWLPNNRITMEAKFNNGSQLLLLNLNASLKKKVYLQSIDNK